MNGLNHDGSFTRTLLRFIESENFRCLIFVAWNVQVVCHSFRNSSQQQQIPSGSGNVIHAIKLALTLFGKLEIQSKIQGCVLLCD